MNTLAEPSATGSATGLSDRMLVLLALLPFLALALWELRDPLSLSVGDQAQYLLHARALLEGRGYTDNGYIHYPSVGISPAAYPPGLPALIALIEGLGGTLFGVRLALIALAAGFLYLAGIYLAREERWLGPAAVFVCGLVPQLALFASGLYTDLAFATLVWGCFLIVDRPGEPAAPWGWRRIAALTVLGALAIAFRTVGVALIPALVAYQAWRTWRHREPWARAAAPVLVWLATYLVIDFLLPVSSGYAKQITGAVAASPERFAFARQVVKRALEYREFVSEFQLVPTPWRMVNLGYRLVALGLATVGVVVWMRRAGVRFLFCFIVFYVGVTMVMPWAIARFLWPLLPVLWFATLDGARLVVERLGATRRRALEVGVAAALILPILAVVSGPAPEPIMGARDLPQGRQLYDVLAAEARRGPVRAFYYNPRDIALMNGISAMGTPVMGPDSLLAEARAYRITHAVVGTMRQNDRADARTLAMIAAHPDQFERVLGNGEFTLYRLRQATGAPVVRADSTGTGTP